MGRKGEEGLRVKWVTIKKAAELTGYAEKEIRMRIFDGIWRRDVVWTWIGSHMMISLEAFERWVEGLIPPGPPIGLRHIKAVRARPRWADRKAIAEKYRLAREATHRSGIPHSVDHIVPLNSRVVCGLHVETNLRIVPSSDNSRKGNRWDPEWLTRSS